MSIALYVRLGVIHILCTAFGKATRKPFPPRGLRVYS